MYLKLLKKGSSIRQNSGEIRCFMLETAWVTKYIHQFSLFIIGVKAAFLEVIVSRTQYIASRIENKIQIVPLSSSLANANDLGEWIRATFHCLFNFPLEINIQGVDIANFEPRCQLWWNWHILLKSIMHRMEKNVERSQKAFTTHCCRSDGILECGWWREAGFSAAVYWGIRAFHSKNSGRNVESHFVHRVGYLHEGLRAAWIK
jgi:hypothetical protein